MFFMLGLESLMSRSNRERNVTQMRCSNARYCLRYRIRLTLIGGLNPLRYAIVRKQTAAVQMR